MSNFKAETTIALIKLDRDINTPTYIRKRVRQEIFKRFEKYVYKLAHQYRNYSPLITFDHLVSAGRIALVSAMDDFDISKGTYFSTWAYNKIKFGVWHSLNEDKGIPKYYKAINDNNGDEDGREFDIADEKELDKANRFSLTSNEKEKLHDIVEKVLAKHYDKYVIVAARFGLLGDKPMSNKECCEVFGISPSKVSASVRYFRKQALAQYKDTLSGMYIK
ncbi:MAG: sigma-70 family RNA polymerase sigma factor [Nitrososphaeraceae archaeon]|nr:sigma-70 family RNA polymerase sigma factor [Nitrososphaeraceae archaeon]